MLPFTREAFLSFLAHYNAGLWPVHVPALLLGLAALLAAVRPHRGGDRVIGAVLAAAWICTGWLFHIVHFAGLHFAAEAFGVLSILQGLWLGWAAGVRGTIRFRFVPGTPGWTGIAMAVAGLAGLPLTGIAAGHGWAATPTFALTPGPTALFTLGMLLLAVPRVPLALMVIPVLWALSAGAAGRLLELPEQLFLAPAALLALVAAFWKNRAGTG